MALSIGFCHPRTRRGRVKNNLAEIKVNGFAFADFVFGVSFSAIWFLIDSIYHRFGLNPSSVFHRGGFVLWTFVLVSFLLEWQRFLCQPILSNWTLVFIKTVGLGLSILMILSAFLGRDLAGIGITYYEIYHIAFPVDALIAFSILGFVSLSVQIFRFNRHRPGFQGMEFQNVEFRLWHFVEIEKR